MSCSYDRDDLFGPQYCRAFDLTLLFEQSFLQIAPCAVLLLYLPGRLIRLKRQSVKILKAKTRIAKTLALLALIGTQIALVVAWALVGSLRTRASIPSAILSLLASMALLYLSNLEHLRSTRPSSTINAFVFTTIVLDVPQCRSLWLRYSPGALPVIFTMSMIAKTVVLYLEARSKKSILLIPYRLYGPEVLVNLYDRTLLWWLNPLFIRGYKGLITYTELFTIDPDLASERNERAFLDRWVAGTPSKWPLLRAMSRMFTSLLIAIGVSRLGLSALKLSQPLLTRKVTLWLSEEHVDTSAGRGLIGATVLLYVSLALVNVTSKRLLDRLTTQVRGVLISVMHSKSLAISTEHAADGAVLSLMTNDTDRICSAIPVIAGLFAAPFEIGVAVFLLERQIGVSCLAPVLLTVAISVAGFANSKRAFPFQKKWLAAVQQRVSYTASVLNFPKGSKMLGLTEILRERIQDLRISELAASAAYRKFVAIRNALGFLPDDLAPAVALSAYSLISGRQLDGSVAFTALSLVEILCTPIHDSIVAMPEVLNCLASGERIEEFLLRGETFASAEKHQKTPSCAAQNEPEPIELSVPPKSIHDGSPVVEFRNVSVHKGSRSKTILDSVSFSIPPAALTCIVGPVGSGKSTLLHAVINELKCSSGERILSNLSQDFGYCAQDPWLPSGTIQRLIIGPSSLDEPWYTAVVNASALDIDFASFPQGDQTVIGSKGLSLSGGQKQKVALARALYSRQNFLVFDDILAGLDAISTNTITSSLKSTCRMYNTTIVIATHATQHLHLADHIIVMGDGGRITQQGSLSMLRTHDAGFHTVEHHTEARHRPDHEDRDARANQNLSTDFEINSDLQEDLARQTGDTAVYKYYAASIGWKLISIMILTAMCFAFGKTFPQVWVLWWVGDGDLSDRNRPISVWIGVYVFVGTIASLSNLALLWNFLVWIVPKSSAQLHRQILNSVMDASFPFLVSTDAGTILNRFATDMSLIESQLAGGMVNTVLGSGACIGSAALIAAGSDYVGIAIPFVVGILYLLQKFYLRTSRQLRFMELEAQGPLLSHALETLEGASTIRAFGWEHYSHQRCLELLDKSQRPFYLLLCIQRWLNLVLDLVTAAIATVVVTFAIVLNGNASPGSVGLSLLNVLSFNSLLANLVTSWTLLETSLGAVARCRSFETSTPSEHRAAEVEEVTDTWPSTGDIYFSQITAAYSETGPATLSDITLHIRPGTKVGICGRSGSGKTSLLLTLFHMIEMTAGNLFVDGVDLASLPRAVSRRRFTAVPQETLLLPGTVLANLDPENSHTPDVLRSVLVKTGLLDLVNTQGGLEADMKELGLSQGELQSFAVARALLRPSRLLVLDEMTSGVDESTESRLLTCILAEFRNSTVIAVAHRLRTLLDFDFIVVMDAGRIVEQGHPQELLRKENGWFSRLWESNG
ncbi:putative ABC transporter [Aureobasidium namibiae CBS 147.97]|uniref:Putative ABC transporter n=1 Tax=Aureobasidium namibiae CBS 147.97 TaxID=1043004 RepID=A0A074X2J1_9PEZI|nr:putative ABC transporter [Aureobasidium namibiae CBS 147.97]KEQ68866.1 putative ABC transporter [Aureobasidium namibiae CBS 147.97]